MASHWTSKNAILRDLSVAQGREVPVELENTVGYNEKPPALNYTEDTEEEFYSNCVGGGDPNTGPDLDLIQHMLDMVREVNVTEIEDQDTESETVIEISKIDSSTPSVINNTIKQDNALKNGDIKHKGKKNRNAAMESLIATYGYDFSNNNNNNENLSSAVKSNDVSNDSSTVYPFNKLKSPLAMFKKKSPKTVENVAHSTQNVLHVNNSLSENCIQSGPAKFVPSSLAGETYKKYVELSKTQEQVKEDIWSRVEMKMKEIDDLKNRERKQLTALSLTMSDEETNSSELRGMDFVRLPQHRHLLTGECKVCQVLCVHSKEDVRENNEKEIIGNSEK